MSALNPEVQRHVVNWIAYADEDLRLARHGLTLPGEAPFRLIAYHAQQCVEKYLKAYLVLRGLDFPYTHDLARLRNLCVAEADWPDRLEEVEELTPFAISTRYPGEDSEVTETESLRAIEIAERVRVTLRSVFSREGIPI